MHHFLTIFSIVIYNFYQLEGLIAIDFLEYYFVVRS